MISNSYHNKSGIFFFLGREIFLIVSLMFYLSNFVGLRLMWSFLIFINFAIIMLKYNKTVVDKNLIYIIFFILSYLALFDYHGFFTAGLLSKIFYALYPVSFYVIGKYLAHKYNDTGIVSFLLLVLVLGVSFIPFVSNVVDVLKTGFMTNRNIVLIWFSKDVERAATGVGMMMALNMSLLGFLFIKLKSDFEKKIKLFALILFLMGLFSFLNMSTRFGFFISTLSLISILAFANLKTKISAFVYSLSAVAIVLIFLSMIDVLEWLIDSPVYTRFTDELSGVDIRDVSTVPRIFRWGYAIDGLFKYPLGGRYAFIAGTYAHNLWLDVGFSVGIIPLIFLLILTYRFIKNLVYLTGMKFYPVSFRMLMLCLSVGFIFSFLIEPVMYGAFEMFCLWMLFIGVTYAMTMKGKLMFHDSV